MLKYKGFYGSVSHSIEDEVIHGKIECINDLVTYEAETIAELKAAFEEAVDDYLETCELIGKEPEKPMSGSFNVRIGPELHKKAYLEAKSLGLSLNELVKVAVEEKLSKERQLHMHVHVATNKAGRESSTFTSSFGSSEAPRFKFGTQSTKLAGMH
ncbi:antitoxin HicB [Vibrio diabolicus]|nr:antitoxin HicB [Vibrio diabolicus]